MNAVPGGFVGINSVYVYIVPCAITMVSMIDPDTLTKYALKASCLYITLPGRET